MSTQSPLLLPQKENIFVNPLSQMHHLIIKNTLILTLWKVSGRALDCKEFQAKHPDLYQHLGGQARFQITIRSGESLLAGVIKNN